jgi:signal peptide peptidase SppA
VKHSQLARLLNEHPLAILPAKLEQIDAFLQYRFNGGPAVEFEAAAAPAYNMQGSVAVIPVFGAISKRMNMMSAMSGGTSTELLAAQIRQAVADPGVRAVVLAIDSPGGSVYGVQELADTIFQARESKRIVAVADALAASAAYWIGSAASDFVVTPSGEVGSIGVVAMHVDYSGQLAAEGVKVTYIHAGENKVEGNQAEPLNDTARSFMQQRVDEYYSAFVGAVARHRGVHRATVEKSYGQGRVYGAEQALSVGMVDRIATLSDVVRGLQPRTNTRRAAADAYLYGIEAKLKTL